MHICEIKLNETRAYNCNNNKKKNVKVAFLLASCNK